MLAAAVLCGLLAHGTARAEDADVGAAAAAFARGQEAELANNHAQAADFYELADRMSPAPGALRSAARARLAAGQLGSAATHAEELKRRYPEDAASATLAADVLAQAKQNLARAVTTCRPDCQIVIDGLAAGTDSRGTHIIYVRPGTHTVVARFPSGTSTSMQISASAGQDLTADLVEPAQASPPPAPPSEPAAPEPLAAAPADPTADTGASSSGLSPAVGIVIGVVAVGLGGAAVWSSMDTRSARDDFEKKPTREAFDDGESKDLRTNVLIGASAVVGAASVGVLVFATDWSGGEASAAGARLHLVSTGTNTGLRLAGSF